MVKIKEYRVCENGDYDILVSFSKEDIDKIGIDTKFHLVRMKDVIKTIWSHLKKEISADDKRMLG